MTKETDGDIVHSRHARQHKSKGFAVRVAIVEVCVTVGGQYFLVI